MRYPFRTALPALLALAAACSSSGDPGTGPGPTPTISLGLSAAAATVTQGGNAPVTATLTRGGGYAGTVDLTVEGAPTGVTGAVSGVVTSGSTTTATVTISVAPSVVPGSYNLTIRGTGSGVTAATAAFTLTVSATPSFTLALSAATLSVTQGAGDAVLVTLTRTNYPAEVTLALDGAPAGVTGVFAPAATTGNTSALTVSAGGSVAPGVYNLTVRGTGAGAAVQSAPLALTVTAAPSYALSLSAPALSIPQGGSAPTTVIITRTNFAGPVTLGLTGLPGGVTVGFAPAAPTGDSSVLTLTVGPGATPGIYQLVVSGTASAGSKTTPLTLTVTQPAGSVIVDFSSCSAANKPVWLGFQSDNGPWQRVLPVGDVYTLSASGTTGGIAYLSNLFGSFSTLSTQFGTAAELTGGVIMPCGPNVVRRPVTATFQNLGLGNFGRISYAGSTNSRSTDGAIALGPMPEGSFDMVAMRAPAAEVTNPQTTLILRRAQTNGDFGILNFNGPEAFPGQSATFTAQPLTGNEFMQYFMLFYSGPTCSRANLLSSGILGTSTATTQSVPDAKLLPGDFHVYQATASGGANGNFTDRQVRQSFHFMADRSVVFPAVPPQPVVTIGSGWTRIRATFTRPAEYDGRVVLSYIGGPQDGRTINVLASAGYLAAQGGNTFIEPPQLIGVSGFDPAWLPSFGVASYVITYSGGTTTGECSEGARVVTGTRTVALP